MKVSLISGALEKAKGIVVIGLGEDEKKREVLGRLSRDVRKVAESALRDDDFKGKRGETTDVRVSTGSSSSMRLLIVGLGPAATAEVQAMQLGVAVGRRCAKHKLMSLVCDISEERELTALSTGLALGAYTYTEYMTDAPTGAPTISVVLAEKPSAAAKRAFAKGQDIARGVNFARDLINAPPNDLTPRAMAEAATTAASDLPIRCKILDKKGITKQGMNLLLAVNKGSDEEPRLIHLHYRPEKASAQTPLVALVGKGLTFDSGGLCIKPAANMDDMKCDMGGGAVTLATVLTAARLKLPVEIHAVVASTENMSGGSAYRPGDVYRAMNGKTVEIINTDAEGRLALADAFTYTLKLKPHVIVDHATLTGACMVALGTTTAGLYSNRDKLAELYRGAASEVGESVWHMPLLETLRGELKSSIADMKHTGERFGGSITAALFLEKFVDGTPWVHMDIAGPAMMSKPNPIHPKGGTGFGVMTLLRFLENLGADPKSLSNLSKSARAST